MESDLLPTTDTAALILVLVGTWLATFSRCGFKGLASGISALRLLAKPPFDDCTNRIILARTIQAVEKSGPLCADVPLPPDPHLAQAVSAYLAKGSLQALREKDEADRQRREQRYAAATRMFETAGELAPVFGLVGTLYAIAKLTPIAGSAIVETTMSSVALAAHSTLFGVLSAHLVYFPIAYAIQRQSNREESRRKAVLDWLVKKLEPHERRAARPEPIRSSVRVRNAA